MARRYDVVFVQRVILPLGLERILKSLNDRVVFDFDDAIFAREEGVSGGILSRIVEKRSSRGLPRMLRAAKCAIVENAYTMEYARRYARHVAVITGPIDTNRYVFDKRAEAQENNFLVPNDGLLVTDAPSPTHHSPLTTHQGERSRGLVIGWIGSPGTVRYLEALTGVLRQVAEKYPEVWVMVIGARFSVDGVRVVHRAWRLETEVEDLREFDVGVMPLPDNAWTRGKGGYKLLQYMAMEIPAVASPVGINREIVEDGANGFLAKDEEEWVEKLSLLIERPDLRKRFRRAGRRTVEERYSLDASVPRFVEVLRKAQFNE